ncbi:MAG: cation:proton antiporter [Fimbriimonas sp.]
MTHDLLLQLAVILAGAKLLGEVAERYLGQPAVLAEIIAGVLLGTSVFHIVDGKNEVLLGIAEIGAVLLLFEVGLECDIDELFKVGGSALWVAIAGVIAPFGLGYLVAMASGLNPLEGLFCGAALTATSVGITARVFTDLATLHTREARIVLGAAVADDVIGLIILAAVSGLAATKTLSWTSVGWVTLAALAFLVGAIVIGLRASPYIIKWARAMRTRAAVSSAAVVLCLLLASVAQLAGLAPIVGAFACGLVLVKTEQKIHFEEKVRSIADLFVPVFFVMMGARMDLGSIDAGALRLGLGLFAVAVIGKVLGGLTVPGQGIQRWVVAVGMIPRGEVGLIFASIGLSRNIVNQGDYAAIVFVVVATTFITPPLLKLVSHRLPDLRHKELESENSLS